jgi:ABC-2 type transport system ATP-binding protein
VIQAQRLTKRYGHTVAVDRADFIVRAGRVTGLLGPAGAGKSTTLRLALGIDRPTTGSITIGGRRYEDLNAPLREVGALLDARAAHGGRTAYNHLLCLARSGGISEHRIKQVLGQVGLDTFAQRPVRTFSLGMRQRLGMAAALLGDPRVVVLDAPTRGLDVDSIRWLGGLLRRLARDGRTVLVAGHSMAEMAFLADHLLVISQGRVRADVGVREFVAEHAAEHVRVRSPQVGALAPALAQRGWKIELTSDRALLVYGAEPGAIGEAAWSAGARVHELTEVRPSLDAAYLRLIDAGGGRREAALRQAGGPGASQPSGAAAGVSPPMADHAPGHAPGHAPDADADRERGRRPAHGLERGPAAGSRRGTDREPPGTRQPAGAIPLNHRAVPGRAGVRDRPVGPGSGSTPAPGRGAGRPTGRRT